MNLLNEFKKALVPFPKFDLIDRDLKHPKPNKWELKGYKLDLYSDKPKSNFGLLYKMLPDVAASDFIPPGIEGEDKLKRTLESNKFSWLRSILEFEPQRENIPEVLLPAYLRKREIQATTVQPLIVGLGEASPYETSITLDHLTGLPIIPGSAVKGITRRAAILNLAWKKRSSFAEKFKEKFGFELQCFDNSEYADLLPYGEEFAFIAEKIEKDLKSEKFTKVFGTQGQKGKTIFMDAYPIEWPSNLFRLDVMNPHYQPYYESEGKNPPADWYNPVPVFYLTVNIGVRYRFVLASEDENLLNIAQKWLEFALTHIGVGAKGNQGYGIFKDVKTI